MDILTHPRISSQRIVNDCPTVIEGIIGEAVFHFQFSCILAALGVGETEEDAQNNFVLTPVALLDTPFNKLCGLIECLDENDLKIVNEIFNTLLDRIYKRNSET